MTAPDPYGSVYVEYRVTGRWATSLLTTGWTDEEKQALLDGDEDARDALLSAHAERTMQRPDEVDESYVEIEVRQRPEAVRHG